MLHNYLNANLLSITDDEAVKKLQKSADEIVKKLLKSKEKIVSYTLVAVDPNVTVSNPDIIEAKEIITKNWSTFSANSRDTPLTYIRAVMLEALKSLAEDVNMAMLIWFSSRNLINYRNLLGEEKEIVINFLTEQANKINKEANTTWAILNPDKASMIKTELKDVVKYVINSETLQKYLEDASGPSNVQGVTNFESPNPHWSNNAPSWSYEFAPRAAKGIKVVLDNFLKTIATVINENNSIIQSTIDAENHQVARALEANDNSLNLRTELLWWKEASYSPLVDKSYSEVEKGILELVLAQDYSSLVPVLYPKSADYFLKEACLGLINTNHEEVELNTLIRGIKDCSFDLGQLFPRANVIAPRMTLLGFVLGIIRGEFELSQFEEILGFSPSTKISSANLTLWLFHDFQLLKAIKIK